jgi:hypothetical protein
MTRLALLGALLLAGCVAHTAAPAPAGVDLSTTRVTENRAYRATVVPMAHPVPLNQVHSWTVQVAAVDGRPVEAAIIHVDGGMPQHGHGLPTRPRVTRALGEGQYLVEGMKFNMPGWWTVRVRIDGPAGSDAVTFNLML